MLERTFVFADLAGYTALTEAHGDDDAAQIALAFHQVTRDCLPETALLVKTIGDAVMIATPSIDEAVVVALKLVRAVTDLPAFPAVRVGLHVGSVIERDGDYFGATVNLAARVAGVARAGEIVCTEPVARVAVDAGLAAARPMGTVRLKNIASPVTLFELNVDGPPDKLLHVDPVCRMRVSPETAPALTDHAGTTFYFCSLTCAARFKQAPESHLPMADEKSPVLAR